MRLQVPVDQFGRVAEGAATGKDSSTGTLKGLRSEAKNLYPAAAARERRQLSKARVIDSEEVVLLRDRAAAREEMEKLGTKSKGNEIEVICLRWVRRWVMLRC